jgi:ABC-type transport system involved in multi-copper enzyme maturation permease subunit
MVRELYKMLHKRYYLTLMLLLLIPLLFGIGYFFDLPYMLDDNALASSALDYCADMQTLIKYFYFLVITFFACDALAGEFEEGQLRILVAHVSSRKKILLQKFFALCFLITVFHILFWVFNFVIYYLCNIKNHLEIILLSKKFEVYAGVFWGYLESFYLIIAITLLMGLFLRKIYTLVIIYFVWFAFRYVDQLVSMKNIFPEFMADYLYHATISITSINIWSYMIALLLCFMIMFISICLFRHKDIK